MTRRDMDWIRVMAFSAFSILVALSVYSAGGGVITANAGAPGRPSGATRVPLVSTGKIAFSYGNSSLRVINPDGSGQRELARVRCGSGSVCGIRAYVWSPTGTYMAFLGGRLSVRSPSNLSLFVVKADGSGTRRLAVCGTCGTEYQGYLSWSPDGSRIVFSKEHQSPQGESLYVVHAASARIQRLTHCRSRFCIDVNPAWSPDGSKIVFSRFERGRLGSSTSTLYIVKLNTTRVKRLTRRVSADNPIWYPDGRRILFDTPDGIDAVAANGSTLRVLVPGSPGSGPGFPSWSPDHTRIAFYNTPGHPGAFTSEVWVMNADGSGRRRLYHSPCCVGGSYRPTWSPNGRFIAFGVLVEGPQRGTWIMDADGRHVRRLLPDATDPIWQPVP